MSDAHATQVGMIRGGVMALFLLYFFVRAATIRATIRISCVVSLLIVPILWTADVAAAPASKIADRASHAGTGLESGDPVIRRQAITKLVADRDPSAVAQLSLTLEGDDDESVRVEAAAGLDCPATLAIRHISIQRIRAEYNNRTRTQREERR